MVLSAGGGTTAAGLVGTYYNNLNLAGTPAFSRADVRVDFDWGGTYAAGGSTSPGYSSLGTNGFSARWTGQVIPRFSESYTFTTTTAGGVRLSIKPAGSSTWTPLVNDWTDHESAKADGGTITLVAGQAYDVRMDYFAATGHPVARLGWSSASTPSEVIEPLADNGYNFLPYALPEPSFADAFLQGRDQWAVGNQTIATDSNGWPLADADKLVWEGKDPASMAGTYRLTFQGKASVTVRNTGTFSVGSTSYGATLPAGAGYDPATNTTTALYTTAGDSIMTLMFRDTRRTAASPLHSGITQVHLMRPTTVGGTTDYAPGTLFTDPLKDALSRFSVIRYGTSINSNTEVNWSDRALPTYDNARKGFGSMAWENLVMLSNEIGKDMYVLIPMGATDDYVTRLARLIKYGSDGVNPYDSPQAHPAYPPLSPNLRVYLEWSNEIWNWSYTQSSQGVKLAADAIARKTRDGQIINYDGHGNYQRWAAVRTVDTSNIFRSVFGDAAMGNRVRVLLEYQYNNLQQTASSELTFLDNYFNNGDGTQHVAAPHPVSYYLWGAGGANYYESGNSRGSQSAIVFQDAGFESPALAAGTSKATPTGTPWTFTGDAGIVSNDASLLGGVPGAPEGTQVAYLGSSGSLGTTVNFTSTGVFALDFSAAAPDGKEPGVDIFFDGQKINPRTYGGVGSYTAVTAPYFPGKDFAQNYRKYASYGTVPFQVTSTGQHTISVVSRGDGNGKTPSGWYLFLDQFKVTSLDAIYGGGVPAPWVGGFSSYEAQLANQASYAQAFGLHVVAYEGGWGVGNEFNQTPLDSYAKFVDPRTRQANLDSINAFDRSGGDVYVFGSFPMWSDLRQAASYPLVQSIDASNRTLPAETTNGLAVPATLAPSQATWQLNVNNGKYWTTGLSSWNVLVPETGNYVVSTQTSYTDGITKGTMTLSVDGSVSLGQGSSDNPLSGTVYLTRGLHTVMVKNIKGSFWVPKVVVAKASDPTPTAASAVAASSSQINLSWTDNSSNETGFKVYRATDAEFTQGLTLATTTGPNVTSWQDKGLTPAKTYYYRVCASTPNGDTPFSNTTYATTLGASTGSVSGRVFVDQAGDGNADSGDPGAGGWEVGVYDDHGKVVATQISSSDGGFAIGGLASGDYTVRVAGRSGWVSSKPADAGYSVTLGSGQAASGLDFGQFQTATVSGSVFNDLTGNGVRDSGDPALTGWKIDLVNASDKVVATTTSAADGRYTFSGIGPGRYTVREIIPSGWTQILPSASSGEYSFQASSGVSLTGDDFGNFQLVTLSGNVFGDTDGNGARGTSEKGLSGWTVELRDPNGNLVTTARTDESGTFAFDGVGPGTWTIGEVVPTDWVQSQPSYPTTYSLRTRSGRDVSSLSFGNHQATALNPTAVVDNQAAGYSETGSWSTVATGYGDSNRLARTVQRGDATATAQWTFSGLSTSSLYDVYVTYRARSGNTTAATFTVSDGATAVGSVEVNEYIPITVDQGLAQGSYGGVGWVKLGSFGAGSGKLSVLLGNLASGNNVDADGVLLVKQGAAKPVAPATASLVGPATASATSGEGSSTSSLGVLPLADASGTFPVVYGKRTPSRSAGGGFAR